jgi:hypothetical protein
MARKEDASDYRGAQRLAQRIADYWAERGRHYVPVPTKHFRNAVMHDEQGRAVWGLKGEPIMGGVPPRVAAIRGGLSGKTY